MELIKNIAPLCGLRFLQNVKQKVWILKADFRVDSASSYDINSAKIQYFSND